MEILVIYLDNLGFLDKSGILRLWDFYISEISERSIWQRCSCHSSGISLGFKPIPECATPDSRVSDQGRICDFIY